MAGAFSEIVRVTTRFSRMSVDRGMSSFLHSEVTDCCHPRRIRPLRKSRLLMGDASRPLEACAHLEASVADTSAAGDFDLKRFAVGQRNAELLAWVERFAVQKGETPARNAHWIHCPHRWFSGAAWQCGSILECGFRLRRAARVSRETTLVAVDRVRLARVLLQPGLGQSYLAGQFVDARRYLRVLVAWIKHRTTSSSNPRPAWRSR